LPFLSFREIIHGHPIEAANATDWRAGWIDCQEARKKLWKSMAWPGAAGRRIPA
jgi:hypothetical protein